MKNSNAIKFSFLLAKKEVKTVVSLSFDHDVSISYPQLKDAPEVVKLKGFSSIGDFELFIKDVVDIEDHFLDSVYFFQNLKFKLVELEQNPVELPTGAEKEETKKIIKK